MFPNIDVVPLDRVDFLPKSLVEILSMKNVVFTNMHKISKTYSESMPGWVVAKYFSPESEHQRLVVPDYQQTELEDMRRMDNTKLIATHVM